MNATTSTARAIPLTPPGPLWSQREYIECRKLGIGFAAHRFGDVRQVFHYRFPIAPPGACTSVIVSVGGVDKYIDHPFEPRVDWLSQCAQAVYLGGHS